MKMKLKNTVSLILVATLAASLMTGCKSKETEGMIADIDAGKIVTFNVANPSTYTPKTSGESKNLVEWTQLDQLKTYNMGFRQGFDEIFNINIVNDNTSGIGGKQGCIFVVNVDGKDIRSGNTTLSDAMRNKVFITKYWNDKEVRSRINALASEVYTDVDSNSGQALEATLNAYFNLLDTAKEPDSFNAFQTLTREEFYAFLVRSTTGVYEVDKQLVDNYKTATGSDSTYAPLAASVQDLNFINIENGGLNSLTVNEPISRLEAVYMIVKHDFPDMLNQMNENSPAYSDTKFTGDLALKVGFKEEVKKERTNPDTGKTEKYKELIEKPMWEAYTLAYMLDNTDKGMQDELYYAMAVAKALNLYGGNTSRWNEKLNKEEAIDLILSMNLAKNDMYGFATTTEYAEMNADEYNEDKEVIEEGHQVDYDLASLAGELLMKFQEAYEGVNSLDYSTEEDLIEAEIGLVEVYCAESGIELPEDYDIAYREWREQYEAGFMETIGAEETADEDTELTLDNEEVSN